MRKNRIAWVAVAVGLGGAWFAFAPAKRMLLRQPSCLALLGAKARSPLDGGEPAAWLRDNLNAAVDQHAVQRPLAPYVIVSRTAGDADFSNVIVAARTASGWQVSEASQPFDVDAQKLLPFVPGPSRALSPSVGADLDRLFANGCLFQEPREVRSSGRIYDGETVMIEVNDGRRRHVSTQSNIAAGLNGAIGALLAKGGRGYIVPELIYGPRKLQPGP